MERRLTELESRVAAIPRELPKDRHFMQGIAKGLYDLGKAARR